MSGDEVKALLSKATEGSRELDAYVWAVVNGYKVEDNNGTIVGRRGDETWHLGYTDPGRFQRNFSVASGNEFLLFYTTEVGHAILLCEKTLPGWVWGCSSKGDCLLYRRDGSEAGYDRKISKKAATPALAMCVGIIEAMEATP